MLTGTRLQTARSKDGEPAKAAPLGARPLVTVGFAVMAAALAVGAATRVTSGTGLAVGWLIAAGLGLGLAMPAAMNVALGALSAERSGSGSALITALRQVGATIGVAVLGTVLLSGYRSQLSLGHLPAAAAGRGAQQRRRRGGGGARLPLGRPAGHGPDRLRARPGHHARGVRGDRAGQRRARAASSCPAGPPPRPPPSAATAGRAARLAARHRLTRTRAPSRHRAAFRGQSGS